MKDSNEVLSVEIPKNERGLEISFLPDSTYKGKLTVNSIFGKYLIKNDQIKIRIEGVTEMCCDSKTALQFFENLGQVESL